MFWGRATTQILTTVRLVKVFYFIQYRFSKFLNTIYKQREGERERERKRVKKETGDTFVDSFCRAS